MSFPLGKPVFVLTCLAAFTGGMVLLRHAPARADVTLWVFADSHARMYRENITDSHGMVVPSLLKQFQSATGKSARVDLIAGQALDVRLMSLFMSSQRQSTAPDLAEIEIGSVGKFFRPDVNDVGFLPLNHYLEKSGWLHRIVPARFAPWSKGEVIFGIPDDLHPCTITYRKDLFDQAGVDLASASTWPDFQTQCLRFQQYWALHGRHRIAMGLSTSAADNLMILLQQQHVNLINPDMSVHFTDEKTARTLAWYAQAVAGPNQMGTDFNPAPGQNVRDLDTGDICAMITPDWEVGYIKTYGPSLAGKLHMIPLPRFAPDDAATASWGGTMIGITRACPNPDLAWKLIEALYLNRSALIARQQVTGILPPIPEYWTDPVYHQPDPFFAGQKIDETYLGLANQLPPRYVTPYTTTAQIILSVILNRAVSYVHNHGNVGLETACQQWLATGSTELTDIIHFDQAGH